MQKQEFESQKVVEEMTEAEKEELEVRRRRAEGTPCTEENFNEWKRKFEEEMAQTEEEEEKENGTSKDKTANIKKKNKNSSALEDEMAIRMTGYEYFTQKGGVMNLELLEKAAEDAAAESGDEDEFDGVDVDELDVDEDLFDDEEDLDDLDFDDEDEEINI